MWQATDLILYNVGDENTSVTGGWVSAFTSGSWFNTQGEFTKGDQYMHLSADCYKCLIYARTTKKIDVTNFKYLGVYTYQANGSSTYGHNRYFGLCDGSSYNSDSMVVSTDMGWDDTAGGFALDISSYTGSYYICAYASGVYSDVYIVGVGLTNDLSQYTS